MCSIILLINSYTHLIDAQQGNIPGYININFIKTVIKATASTIYSHSYLLPDVFLNYSTSAYLL